MKGTGKICVLIHVVHDSCEIQPLLQYVWGEVSFVSDCSGVSTGINRKKRDKWEREIMNGSVLCLVYEKTECFFSQVREARRPLVHCMKLGDEKSSADCCE